MASSNSKRKRNSEPEPRLSTQHEDIHVIFTRWAQDRGVVINGVEAARIPGRGVGILTTKCVKAGEQLLFIPEKAMFRPNRKLLEDAGLSNASPQAQLAATMVIEFFAPGSPFAVWTKVMPSLESFDQSMPMRSDEPIRNLFPPSLMQPLERQEADYLRDEGEVAKYFHHKHGLAQFFAYCWLIVNSRSFHWKPPRSKGGVMVLCPFIDYMNHAPSESACKVTMTDKGYKVIADRNYAPGEEILATYGPHSNDKLLVHYGFICSFTQDETNSDDDIRIDNLILPPLSDEVRSSLQDVGFLGGYALLPATNELCFKTHVAMRATFLTANEWEYYMQNGEDLGEDQTAEVEKRVNALCKVYLRQKERTVEALLKHESTPLIASLVERWQQIGLALTAFGDKVLAEEEVERETS